MRYKPKEDNNHAFLFNTTATLSGILSAGAFTASTAGFEDNYYDFHSRGGIASFRWRGCRISEFWSL